MTTRPLTEIWITNAPAAYDYSYVLRTGQTAAQMGLDVEPYEASHEVLVVLDPQRMVDFQSARYASGLYLSRRVTCARAAALRASVQRTWAAPAEGRL